MANDSMPAGTPRRRPLDEPGIYVGSSKRVRLGSPAVLAAGTPTTRKPKPSTTGTTGTPSWTSVSATRARVLQPASTWPTQLPPTPVSGESGGAQRPQHKGKAKVVAPKTPTRSTRTMEFSTPQPTRLPQAHAIQAVSMSTPRRPPAVPPATPPTPIELQSPSRSLALPHGLPHEAPLSAASTQMLEAARTVPDAAIMFHMAVEAHRVASRHYQQVFVPTNTSIPRKKGEADSEDSDSDSESDDEDDEDEDEEAAGRGSDIPPIPVYLDGTPTESVYAHDASAAHAAFRLLILALDLLRLCLDSPVLSAKECAAAGLEFATIGSKIFAADEALRRMGRTIPGVAGMSIDMERVAADMGVMLAKSLVAARSMPALQHYVHALEIARYRLAIHQEQVAKGLKILKKALAETPKDQFYQRYALMLRIMGHHRLAGSFEFFKAADDLAAEAEAAGHTAVLHVVQVARLSAHFHLRKWDSLRETFEAAAKLLGIVDGQKHDELIADPATLVATLHYYQFKALHASRGGETNVAKRTIGVLFDLLDASKIHSVMANLRANGGILKIRLRTPTGPPQFLWVQTTPVNLLYATTYYTSTVTRRGFFLESCRTLLYAQALRDHETCAKSGEMWDCGFTPMHGVNDALALRHSLMKLRVEVMMEQALAHMCRSTFQSADALLTDCMQALRESHLLQSHVPQLLLLLAQFAHLMGRPEMAVRYYRAAKDVLVAGSEMFVLVEIGLLAAEGKLVGLRDDYERAEQVNMLADMCRSGTNNQLHAVGNLLSYLTDHETLSSKRKLNAVYTMSRLGDWGMLYAILFAFTAAGHVYGDRGNQFKQLRTGRDVARMLGGYGTNGVGQATLGLWFARKLQEHQRLKGEFENEDETKAEVEAHIARLKDIYEYSLWRFPPKNEDEDKEKEEDEKEEEEDDDDDEEDAAAADAEDIDCDP